MTVGLALFVGFLVLQRLGELALSARNARRVRALGGREHGAGHFPLLVLVHTLFPAGLLAEAAVLGARPGALWPAWLGLWLAAQTLRYAAMWSLGDRWNVRILVVPGMPLVRRGPYRWIAHPNYLAVAIELIAGALLFGAWRTAVGITALNLVALSVRIRAEEEALRSVEPADARSAEPEATAY